MSMPDTPTVGGVLGYDVFVSESIPLALPDRLPNGGSRTWAPISTTLVYGERDAVLIDPPLTAAQADAVGDWVEASGKRLTHILATHAHGDHWFTAATLADRFPGAQVTALAGTIEQMHRALAARKDFWDKILPGQIPASPVTAVPAGGNRIQLENHELILVDVGHSDTDDTGVVHIPDLHVVVAGDVVYNGVHQFLVESGNGGRDAWRSAISVVEALAPRQIVAGHKIAGRDDDAARVIAESRRYLNDVDELLPRHPTPEDFFSAMLERHPGHLNASSLWGSAQALYASH
jgi:glyoxylase-like metal-dependent hydrolase (beta-lactamase superfamily II)